MTRLRKKSRRKNDSNPGSSALEAGALTNAAVQVCREREREGEREKECLTHMCQLVVKNTRYW